MIIENTTEMTVYKLETLAAICRQGYSSEIINKTLNKLFGYETEKSRAKIKQLRDDLADFETKYGMSSDYFYQRYLQGQTDDNMDFVEWASIVQMAQRLEKQLALLTEK